MCYSLLGLFPGRIPDTDCSGCETLSVGKMDRSSPSPNHVSHEEASARMKRFRPPSMHSLTSEAPSRSRRREGDPGTGFPPESVPPPRAPMYSIRMPSSRQAMDVSSIHTSPVAPPRVQVDSTGTEFPHSRSNVDSFTSHGSGRSALGSLERGAERDSLAHQMPISPARRLEPSRESMPSIGSLKSSITLESSSRPPSWTRVPAGGPEGQAEGDNTEDHLTALLSMRQDGAEESGGDDNASGGSSTRRTRRRGARQRGRSARTARRGNRRGNRAESAAADEEDEEEEGDDDGSWEAASSGRRRGSQRRTTHARKSSGKRDPSATASDDTQSGQGGGRGGEKRAPKRWTKAEDQLLRQAVQELGERQWKTIAERVPGRNHVQCLQRWRKALAPGLKKGHWTEEEDDLLRSVVSQGFRNWGDAAQEIPGRTPKQCRERCVVAKEARVTEISREKS